jgi:uncharacterized protein
MAAQFEVSKNQNGQFYFVLRAANGEKILTSELYTAKASALKGIESVRKDSQVEANFDRKTAKDGQPYFVLLAGNGEPIGTSEMYASDAARESGIAAVQEIAPSASLDDRT